MGLLFLRYELSIASCFLRVSTKFYNLLVRNCSEYQYYDDLVQLLMIMMWYRYQALKERFYGIDEV